MWKNITEYVDGNVTKFVFEKEDIAIEAVLYKYPTYQERTVLCISTMCGCPMGCRFCGTGDYFVRSLTSEEIIGQVEYILTNKIDSVDPLTINRLQVMVMSMGEGSMVKELEPSFDFLYSKYPNAALLISTSAPKVDFSWINQMSVRIPTVGLQFSVHESTDEARNKLIPFKNKMTLDEIVTAGIEWYEMTGRNPFFNYCAHPGNSSEEDADRLLSLFDPSIWKSTVSVICESDRNSVNPKANEAGREMATDFSSKMLSRGYDVRVFDPSGQDTLGGGCGQLWHTQKWMKDHPEYTKQSAGSKVIQIFKV